MPARRIDPFKPVIETQLNFPRMSTEEIRRNVQRMRKKANDSIDRLQRSGYYSEALEQRKQKVIKEYGYRPTDLSAYKFKSGERLKNPEMERARLVKEARQLTKFLNSSTRTVPGIKSSLKKISEYPAFELLSEGMEPKEMSFKFKDIFNMADDIKKLYTDQGMQPSSFDKYEAIEELLESIIPAEDAVLMSNEEKGVITREILDSMSQAEKDELFNSVMQKIKVRYTTVSDNFRRNEQITSDLLRKFSEF